MINPNSILPELQYASLDCRIDDAQVRYEAFTSLTTRICNCQSEDEHTDVCLWMMERVSRYKDYLVVSESPRRPKLKERFRKLLDLELR